MDAATRRKKKGEGNIRKRPDGRFEYRLTYKDEFDQKCRKSFYGFSEEECYSQADDFLAVQEMKNRGIDCDKTIPDILREVFEDEFSKNHISEAAYDRKLSTLRIIETNPIGTIPIINITERQLDLFMVSITSYSNSVISKTHQQLRLAYEIAIEEGLVGKNLMKSRKLVKRPISAKPDRVVKGFTEEEQKRFLKALEEDKVPRNRNNYKNQIKIELFTGMRMGEINGLKEKDIDFEKGVICVRRTITKGFNDKSYLKESTKTETGIREIPISNMVRPILEDAIRTAPRNKMGLLFFDTNKKDVVSTQQVNCYFKRLCVKAEIEVRGQHALRHTFATRCIEAGVPAVVLKTWLGHTNIHITLDTYADVFNRMNNDSMKKLEEYTEKLNDMNFSA